MSRVVIIGAGFGGLRAARALRRAPVEVTLLDRRNHHLFQPLLYQVASAGLNPSDIATPIRKILRRQGNVTVLLAEAEALDTRSRLVKLDCGEIGYDFLVVATGATHSYFGHDEWAAFAPGLKSIEDALEIRGRVLFAFEAAERESDPQRRRAWLNFVVIGGGPTGVELAGAFGEIAFHTLDRDFRHIDPTQAKVVLLEGGDRILPAFSPRSSANALAQLRQLGVEVRLGAMVTAIDASGVRVGGEHIEAATAVWAAGVTASPLVRSLGVPLDRAGRVLVRADLSIPDHPEVFVIGDVAAVSGHDGRPVPGVAPAAMQAGEHVARSIVRRLDGLPTEPFRYRDKGSLATVGRSKAVADIGRLRLSGWFAWLTWLVVHIAYLIGFRNRIVVLFAWAWAYLTHERGARLITGELRRRDPARPPHAP
jgi:NADH dehydrogenase